MSELTVDQSRSLLQQVGLRCTSSRVAVLRYLAVESRPVTHSEATAELVPRGYDKSTIYRALVEMSEVGLVSRLDLGDHSWRFELRMPARQSTDQRRGSTDHPHFMCLDCGKVRCLPESSVRLSSRNRGLLPSPGEVTEILLKGRCEECG